MATAPFGSQYPVTLTWNPAIGEYGDDFGTPVGTVIKSPGPGTIIAEEDKGRSDWGYRIFDRLDNGWTFAVGHLSKFLQPTGARVGGGTPIGLSGGAVTDPHGGHTTGPHIEPQLIDPSGKYHDPIGWLKSLWSGAAPSFPSGAGVSGPLPKVGTGGSSSNGWLPASLTNWGFVQNADGSRSTDGGLFSIPNPFDIFKPLVDAWTGWIPKPNAIGNFVVANIIALAVAAIIIIVLLGDSKGGPSTVVNIGATPTSPPQGGSAPAKPKRHPIRKAAETAAAVAAVPK